MTAILAREEHPPGQKMIEWRLLVNRVAEAQKIVVELIDWHQYRWLVEVSFRIWKLGCQIEALQLGTLERSERALVIYLIVAWHILYLIAWGRCPNLPCHAVFDLEEWPATLIMARRCKPPTAPLSLGEMVYLIGGFLGCKGDGYPDPKTLPSGKACRKSGHSPSASLPLNQAFISSS